MSGVLRSAVLSALTGAVLAIAATGVTAAAHEGPGITLYRHIHYKGDARSFSGDVPDLRRHYFNDAASSFRIDAGIWELCEHINYGGRCEIFDADAPNLVLLGWNDTFSSLRRVRYLRHQITVYQHPDFRGQSRRFTEDVPDLRRYSFNDRISSVRVGRGDWLVCEHANYRGKCVRVRNDTRNLREIGLNNRATSLRKLRDGRDRRRDDDWDDHWDRDGNGDRDRRGDDGWAGRGNDRPWAGVTLYEHADYRGAARNYDGNVPDLAVEGFNDAASSIRIDAGIWEFCEHVNYAGRCLRFETDVPTLVPYGFNDRMSSLRRVQ